jgi:BASS family bile acid:Na+ symporter
MAGFNPVTQVVLPAAVALVMFALGTTLTVADVRRVLGRPRAFLVGTLVHALLLPGLAFALAHALALPGPIAVGLVIIASCPANASANLFTHFARGDTMLSVCLTAAASLTSVLSVPFFVNLALRTFPAGHGTLRLPVLASAFALFALSTLPVLAGMRLRQRRPEAAALVERRMNAFGVAVILCVVAVAVWSERESVLPALAAAGLPALALNLLAVSLGWGAAAGFGLPAAQRVAVGLECGLQNFAMAAFVSLTLLRDRELLAPGVAYGLVMWTGAILVVLLTRRGRPDRLESPS